tara:strand:- start:463 stop:2166 length:1704 start_codon:yes stop_codon:yes gene_type:complete
MSAVREGINTIEAATKGKGDPRSEILREEFKRLRENKKKRVRADKLFAKTSIVPVNKIKPQSLLPPSEESSPSSKKEGRGFRDILEDILRVLKLSFKSDKKESAYDKKQKQKQKREKKEKAIESVKGGLKSAAKVGAVAASKLLTPFQKIWQTISNFLKTVIIGALFNGALNWFGKKENQEKMGRVVRFLKFWWPSILAGYLAFFTPIGALVTAVISLLTWALPALAGLIAKNPILAGGALFAMGGVLPKMFPGLVKDEADTAVDESVDQIGTDATIDQLGEQQESRNIFQRIGDFVTGVGAEREEQMQKLETGEEKRYGFFGEIKSEEMNQGGVVPGSGNKDTVPAMLTPGEFVMRKEAVKKYGTNTLAGMNAAGSVSNNINNINNTNNRTNNTTNNPNNRTNTIIENLINNRSSNKNINTIREYKKGGLVQHFNEGGLVQHFNEGGLVEKYKNIAGEKYDPKDPTTIQKTVNELKNQMMSVSSQTIKTVKKVSPTIMKSMGKNMVPVAVPIKVKAISKTTVLPAIEKQKTSQPTRPGTTVPVFNVSSDATARAVTLVALGVEETF